MHEDAERRRQNGGMAGISRMFLRRTCDRCDFDVPVADKQGTSGGEQKRALG